MKRPVALSIAGSDSGGGAGIQADLRVFSKLGVFGTTAITAVTAQNLEGVSGVEALSAEIVEKQIRAVAGGFDVRAVKTGMLWSSEIVSLVAKLAGELRFPALVVDPVMVSTSGHLLLKNDAVEAYRTQLFPKATLITPNLDEAAVLLGGKITTPEEMEPAAKELAGDFGCAVLLKGGHLTGDPVDLLWFEGKAHVWKHKRVEEVTPHGTGCMLSAAIAANMALGANVVYACTRAVEFLSEALASPLELAGGRRLADF